MIGLDTNVLVRYLVQDDEAQSEAAARIIDALTPEAPGFVSTVAFIETVWVLQKAYQVSRERIAGIIETLLRSRELVVENAEAAYLAFGLFAETGADFADALIFQGGKLAGCAKTLTFDKSAAAKAGMTLLQT